ncbi:MAG: phosphoribosylformylglycinamidine synthase subunit PurQ [bacterium]
MTFAVVTFPGSNCDRDCLWALETVMGYSVRSIFHRERLLDSVDAVILPGGFSYGDYLRAGALARFSPIMEEIMAFAKGGGLVLGICNGFQILCEAGLLPGALVRNRSLDFVCRRVTLRVEKASTAFTSSYEHGQEIVLPIAHSEGNYMADSATLKALQQEKRIVFRYAGPVRPDAPDGNPNGSMDAIAGIINAEGNVMGLMPHPERACDPDLGRTDGMGLFLSMAKAIAAKPAVWA